MSQCHRNAKVCKGHSEPDGRFPQASILLLEVRTADGDKGTKVREDP